MKHVKISKGEKAMVDDEDYERINQNKWYLTQKVGSNFISKYAIRTSYGKGEQHTVSMHREVFGLKTGDGKMLDHINGNGLDNRKENLRLCTDSQNQANRRVAANKFNYKGLSLNGKKYHAMITKDDKAYVIGRFDTIEEAALAYNKKAVELFGEFAKLNIIK